MDNNITEGITYPLTLWKDGVDGVVQGGFFIRNDLFKFLRKLRESGYEPVGIKIEDDWNLEVRVKAKKVEAKKVLQELADSGNIEDFLLGTEEEEDDLLNDIRNEDAFKESEAQMLFKVDIDCVPMLYVEADDLATLEQIIRNHPSIQQGLKLNSISPIEDKCYIKKEAQNDL